MSDGDFSRIARRLEAVELAGNEVLAQIGVPIDNVYFLEAGIATLAERRGGRRVGIGHFGHEGLSGWQVLLGPHPTMHEVRIEAQGGTAYRMGASDLLYACEASSSLRALMMSFIQMMFLHLGNNVSSTLTQPAERRLCRWILMAHDHIDCDRILATHREIAAILSVRRATVTDLLHLLESKRLIRSARGQIVVLDRTGLKDLAGAAYGLYEAQYSRTIAPFPERDHMLAG